MSWGKKLSRFDGPPVWHTVWETGRSFSNRQTVHAKKINQKPKLKNHHPTPKKTEKTKRQKKNKVPKTAPKKQFFEIEKKQKKTEKNGKKLFCFYFLFCFANLVKSKTLFFSIFFRDFVFFLFFSLDSV